MAARVPRVPDDPEVRRLRSNVALATRYHKPEAADAARRDLKALRAERYVRELVDQWPPLTDSQRGRLAALLADGGSTTVASDAQGRRLGQTDGPAETTSTQKVPTRIADGADGGDGGDPRAIGELLNTWLAIQMDQVDDLVDEARGRAAAIPDQRQLWLLFGESLVRLHALELEVAQLRAEVGRLRQRRGRAA
jgi:hypothetical protein